MNYTLEHLKIVYNAGAKKFPFDQALELISLLGEEGLSGLLAHPAGLSKAVSLSPASTPRRPYKRRVQNIGDAPKAGKSRETLSTKIIGFLSHKGESGAHVTEIAEAIKAHQSSVTTWFYNTGKKYFKTGEIKKVAPSTFSYSAPAKPE